MRGLKGLAVFSLHGTQPSSNKLPLDEVENIETRLISSPNKQASIEESSQVSTLKNPMTQALLAPLYLNNKAYIYLSSSRPHKTAIFPHQPPQTVVVFKYHPYTLESTSIDTDAPSPAETPNLTKPHRILQNSSNRPSNPYDVASKKCGRIGVRGGG